MGKIVGIDLDGVVADFNAAYIERVIKLSGKDLFPPRPFDIPCWYYPEFYGYSKEEVGMVWQSIEKDPYFWSSLPAYGGIKSILGTLAWRDAERDSIYFITTRPGLNPKRQTTTWLRDKGFFGCPSVIVSGQKGYIAKGIGLTHFIDDKPENCVDVALHVPICKNYLLTRSWNKDWQLIGGIQRVDSIQQFVDEVFIDG